MLFDYLKRLFGFCDETTRKRQATGLDINEYDYIRPKKICRDYNNMGNSHRGIIEIEDENDDIQFIEDHSCSRYIKSMNNLKQRNNTCCNNHQFKQQVNNHVSKKNYLSNTFPGKSRLNSRPSAIPRNTALSKTHQLREKEQYGQILQNFLPQVEVIAPRPEKSRVQKPVEVIDIDTPSTSKGDGFSTPISKLPTRWFTPMSRPAKSTQEALTRGKPIEVITVHESDNGATTQKPNVDPIKKLSITRETIHTNSLRDRLSGKDVVKADFVSRVAKRYNDRFERTIKEAEELKKTTNNLARDNRIRREVALEERLAKSLQLWQVVFEEKEEDEVSSLPELSVEMLAEVEDALITRPPDEILVDAFGLRITRKDISTLAGLNWLNDEIINFYMNLLIQRGNEEKYPNVYAMNTFFYPKLVANGHSALKRWTRKIDIFAQDIVVVPVHLRMHWCMSIIDFRNKTIRYYDSMGGDNQKCLQALKKYLEDESLDKKKTVYNTSDWTLECMSDIPQQMNGSDCGVFSCTFAEFICADRKFTFSQGNMPYFRNKMVYEILKAKLL